MSSSISCDVGVSLNEQDFASKGSEDYLSKEVGSLAAARLQAEPVGEQILSCDQKSLVLKANILSDFTLSHLSKEGKQEIKNLFRKMGKMITKYNLSNDDIEFLLKAVPDARSTLIPKWTPDDGMRMKKIAEFRKAAIDASKGVFAPDFEDKIQKHAVDIETIATAMGYCAIAPASPQLGPPWIVKTKAASPALKKFIQTMAKQDHLVCSIGDDLSESRAFPSRWKEFVKLEDKKDLKTHTIDLAAHRSMEGSFTVELPSQPQPAIQAESKEMQVGLKPSGFKGDSYVMKALELGVNMRSHVSGSAPLTLAAMEFLDSVERKKPSEETLFIRGGLLVAIYQLGDYHSFAETAAGVSHFHQTKILQKTAHPVYASESVHFLQDISPTTFLAMGLGHMLGVVSEDAAETFTQMQEGILECVSSKVSRLKKTAAA